LVTEFVTVCGAIIFQMQLSYFPAVLSLSMIELSKSLQTSFIMLDYVRWQTDWHHVFWRRATTSVPHSSCRCHL